MFVHYFENKKYQITHYTKAIYNLNKKLKEIINLHERTTKFLFLNIITYLQPDIIYISTT